MGWEVEVEGGVWGLEQQRQRERRETERDTESIHVYIYMNMYLYTYMFIYMYKYAGESEDLLFPPASRIPPRQTSTQEKNYDCHHRDVEVGLCIIFLSHVMKPTGI